MKLRTGFVSNSSSSSFIIAYNKEQNKCPHCGRCDVDIVKMIKECTDNDGDTEVLAEGKEEVLNYIKEDFWFEEERQTKLFKEIEEIKNMEIALLNISYHDEIINEIIKTNKDIKILYQDN